MKSVNDVIKLMNQHMESIDQFQVREIGVFGSIARGEQTDESDVDILVEFEENQDTFDHYMDLKFYLEELLHQNVDLVISGVIKDAVRKSIVESVKYAKRA